MNSFVVRLSRLSCCLYGLVFVTVIVECLSAPCSERLDPAACLAVPPWPACTWSNHCIADPQVRTDHIWYSECQRHSVTACLNHSTCLWHSLWGTCGPNLPVLCPHLTPESCEFYPGCYLSATTGCAAEGLLGSVCEHRGNETVCQTARDCEWVAGACRPKSDWTQALELFCARDHGTQEWTLCKDCASCTKLSPVCRLSEDGACTVTDAYGQCRLADVCGTTPGCTAITSTDCWPQVHKFKRDREVAQWATGFYINTGVFTVLMAVNIALLYVPSCQGTF